MCSLLMTESLVGASEASDALVALLDVHEASYGEEATAVEFRRKRGGRKRKAQQRDADLYAVFKSARGVSKGRSALHPSKQQCRGSMECFRSAEHD